MKASLSALLPAVRIQAEIEIIVKPEDKSITHIIHEVSNDADIVFLGLRSIEPGEEVEYKERLIELANGLPTTVFVRNAGEFAGHLI